MTGPVVRVLVAQTKGSTPREAGAQMLVWQDGQSGSIGGGVLEFEASEQARMMLNKGPQTMQIEQALGPELGQCCGGHVALEFERFEADDLPVIKAKTPIWIFGAGHVGRALAQVLAPMLQYEITLIDTKAARLPKHLPDGVITLTSAKMQARVADAPRNAHHYIMTMSHGFDLDICHALLTHDFAYAGLIGSKTKWARFGARLRERGHSAAQIRRITCPIGDPSLGKTPQAIAVGVAHGLLLAQGDAD